MICLTSETASETFDLLSDSVSCSHLTSPHTSESLIRAVTWMWIPLLLHSPSSCVSAVKISIHTLSVQLILEGLMEPIPADVECLLWTRPAADWTDIEGQNNQSESPVNQTCSVFELWEEAGAPEENPPVRLRVLQEVQEPGEEMKLDIVAAGIVSKSHRDN